MYMHAVVINNLMLVSVQQSAAVHCPCLALYTTNLQGHAVLATTVLSMSECDAHAILAVHPHCRAA